MKYFMKIIKNSLLLRTILGFVLILGAIPWYKNPVAMCVGLIGVVILGFVRAETFKQAAENFHRKKDDPSGRE
jgi:uncharacterized membrane-anchored protein